MGRSGSLTSNVYVWEIRYELLVMEITSIIYSIVTVQYCKMTEVDSKRHANFSGTGTDPILTGCANDTRRHSGFNTYIYIFR